MRIWGARVLVVDDDQGILEAAARLLRACGADVITVPTAGEALATVIGVTPDLLVLDITTPGLDGIGLLRAVRALSPEKGGQIPAVTIGARDLVGEGLEVWREAGFQGHLTTPFEPAALAALVDRLAGHAVERRRRTLDRRQWPRDVSHDRRAEVRSDVPVVVSPETALLTDARTAGG